MIRNDRANKFGGPTLRQYGSRRQAASFMMARRSWTGLFRAYPVPRYQGREPKAPALNHREAGIELVDSFFSHRRLGRKEVLR